MGCTTFGPFSRICANVQVDMRDDEETSLRYTQFGKTVTAYKPLATVVDQRVRHPSAASHWRLAPKLRRGAYSKTGQCLFYDLINVGVCILIVETI